MLCAKYSLESLGPLVRFQRALIRRGGALGALQLLQAGFWWSCSSALVDGNGGVASVRSTAAGEPSVRLKSITDAPAFMIDKVNIFI